MQNITRNIIIIIVVVAVLGGGYYFFFGKNQKSLTGLIKIPTLFPASPELGGRSDFLSTLLNIRNIKLDDTIFSSASFRNLKDFSVQLIQDVKEGRPNPFAPLGVDVLVETEPAPFPEAGTFVEPETILEIESESETEAGTD